MVSLALQSFLIVLREGLEALLVIVALAAFLVRAGFAERRRTLFAGAGAAVLASVGAAWVMATWFGGGHDELVEGVSVALAALLLFYASGWLWLRQDPAAWQGYLRAQADRALATRGWLMLAGIAFLAVFREGAETVLFLHAMAVGQNAAAVPILLGVALAGVALAGLYMAMTRLALKLPLRPLFVATSAFLFFLGLRFTGAALKEFQEMGWVPYREIGLPDWLAEVIGNATLQGVAVETAILLAAVLGVAIAAKVRPRAA